MAIEVRAERRNELSAEESFALWSQSYDAQPNPLLSLEESFLASLLPDVRGMDIADVGCGTGRWIERLLAQSPRSVTGIDSSSEMLARARIKVGRSATLLLANAVSLPLPDRSADLALVSFVISHVAELEATAEEVARVLRPGGTAFISDAHPDAVSLLGWKRGFKHEGEAVSLRTYDRPLCEIVLAFEACGFESTCLVEPSFQSHELDILRFAGKGPPCPSFTEHPAIYVLQLRRSGLSGKHVGVSQQPSPLAIAGARVSFGARHSAAAQLTVSQGVIETIQSARTNGSISKATPVETIDLTGYMLLPGLINSHDHLEFGLFPNLGRGKYRSALEWAEDIHSREAEVIAQHLRISKSVRCWWGALRNLLCGVTTVCHHNPQLPEFSHPDFPVRVNSDLGWAHSLAFDQGAATKFANTEHDAPFVLHAAEGIDEQSACELYELDRREMLGDRTVLVHGLGMGPDDASLLKRRGASLVWCPTSNCFLFGRTHTAELLSLLENVVLGSDSPMTAAGDLLDEIRYAGAEIGVPPEEVYAMVINRAAKVFRLRQGEGCVRVGGVADFIAVRDTGRDPADVVATLSSFDIELVIIRGRVHLARDDARQRLPLDLTVGLEPIEIDGARVWVRGSVAQMFASASAVLGNEIRLGNRRVRHAGSV